MEILFLICVTFPEHNSGIKQDLPGLAHYFKTRDMNLSFMELI